LSWLSPNTTKLNISSDTDLATPGWQGTLSVQTDVGGSGATVQFSTGAGNLGAPVAVNGSGVATSPVISIDDAAVVKLTATTSDVPSRGVGTVSQTVVVDTKAPSAIADLAASVPAALRRQTGFHLAWTAPIDTGGSVASYDVRVAKGTPINAGNFDAQEQIGFPGAAAAAGSPDGVDVTGRIIENDYYFAVAAIDQAGNRGPLAAAGPTAAHFNATVLAPGNAAEAFGYTVDGSTSLDGDAYSDLVVGAENSKTVYIYMGSATGYPSTPTATITGSIGGFGISANIVGDIDSDGLPDLAIGSPLDGNGTVYIFKGRHPWPASLQQSDADYFVQAGSGFSNSFNGFTITRLGDFNADNIDDFAVGAPFYSSGGRISVIYGVANGSAFGTVSLPADYNTRALEISVGTTSGQTLAGLGRYYAGGGTTLVGGAPASAGRALAFHGLAAQVGPVTTADQTFTGPLTGGRASFGLGFLGGGGSVPVVGVGSSAQGNSPGNGQVDLFAGNVATGPFSGAHAIFTNSKATGFKDAFGIMVLGSAFANGVTTSIIGDSAPDVVLGASTEGGAATHIYLLTGQNAIVPGTRDIVSAADVSYQMPLGWQGCSNYSSTVKDANGDGYADLAIGERRLTTGINGQVLVLW
jgi:FG-GAP-like repeat/FG-GAP repeat